MLVGKPWEVISDYAARNGFDLIVMGTRGLGTYTGAVLGSVAQGVAQRCHGAGPARQVSYRVIQISRRNKKGSS